MSAGFYLPDSEETSFTRYLMEEFTEVLGPDEPALAREAARGLTAAMREYGFEEEIPSDLLNLMFARILWSLNRCEEAETYIQTHFSDEEKSSLYRTLVQRSDFDIRTWQLLDSRVLCRQTWDSLHQHSVWVINLESLCHDSSLLYEMGLFGVVRHLIEQLDAFGDERAGEFFVALRGFMPMQRTCPADVLKRFAQDVLDQMMTRRKWLHRPVVGYVDLPVA